MLDGFRADYATREDPSTVPTFTRFEREGVMAKYVQPIYPALSMPSWTTIVTGMTHEGNNISYYGLSNASIYMRRAVRGGARHGRQLDVRPRRWRKSIQGLQRKCLIEHKTYQKPHTVKCP